MYPLFYIIMWFHMEWFMWVIKTLVLPVWHLCKYRLFLQNIQNNFKIFLRLISACREEFAFTALSLSKLFRTGWIVPSAWATWQIALSVLLAPKWEMLFLHKWFKCSQCKSLEIFLHACPWVFTNLPQINFSARRGVNKSRAAAINLVFLYSSWFFQSW